MPGSRPHSPRTGALPRRGALSGALLGLACLLATVPAPALSGRDDGQRALAAREGGRILPLERLVAQVEDVVPGRLLEAELDDDDGTVVYELRWQLADGRRLEIEVDARDGRWLKLKGPRLETAFRRPTGAAAPARVSR